jgi:hypothetical protein
MLGTVVTLRRYPVKSMLGEDVAGTGAVDLPQCSARPHSPSPCASIHPTGPAQRPRSMLSSSLIRSTAAPGGVPHTAAAGCSNPASLSAEASTASSADGCATRWVSASRMTEAATSTIRSAHSGAGAWLTDSAAYRCSSVSFADASRAALIAASSVGSRPRTAVPAMTREHACRPSCPISSSGVAPMSPAQPNT